MPVRSLSSSVLKWPKQNEIHDALIRWSTRQVENNPDIIRIGYFGSYARGDAGVGSDIDLVIVVPTSETERIRRSTEWDTRSLPVPCDLFVFTLEEWKRVLAGTRRFERMLRSETVWVYERSAG